MRQSPSYSLPSDLATNLAENEGQYVLSRSSSWCIAFVRFENPASYYVDTTKSLTATTPRILVVENDAISVSTSAPKSSPYKTMNMSLKTTDIYYPEAVATGDYAFSWMSQDQEHIDYIVRSLRSSNGGAPDKRLFDFNSGLKFFGRVLSISCSESISQGGMRSVDTSIACQAFMEMAASIYFSNTMAMILGTKRSSGEPIAKDTAGAAVLTRGIGMASQYATKLNSFFDLGNGFVVPSCDDAVGVNLVLAMGIADGGVRSTGGIKIPGAFSDSILIPNQVSNILGVRGAKKLWETYNVFLGVQTYSNSKTEPWAKMNPNTDSQFQAGGIISKTPVRCKGWVEFMPPDWSNKPLWSILSEYVNPICNELYTALRIGPDNRIAPTLIMREKPFSTGLFGAISVATSSGPLFKAGVESIDESKNTPVRNSTPAKPSEATTFATTFKDLVIDLTRTYFNNLPRWVIDDSLIMSLNVGTSESERINFTQVWSTRLADIMVAAQVSDNSSASGDQTTKELQLQVGNWVLDRTDVQRHGLRADIATSNFDYPAAGKTYARYWAKTRADWLFNGHLKLSGSVTLAGIQEPICEGDNVEIRGILYHILSVSHSVGISGGRKHFTTSLQIGNGILASPLDKSKTALPQYARFVSGTINKDGELPAISYDYTSVNEEKEG